MASLDKIRHAQILRFVAEIGPIFVFLICLIFIYGMSSQQGHGLAWLDTAIVCIGVFSGFLLAGYKGVLNDAWHAAVCDLDKTELSTIDSDHEFKEGIYLTVCTMCIFCYVLLFNNTAINFTKTANPAGFPNNKFPIVITVAIATSVSLGLMSFFAVRYAAHIRNITMLKLAIDGKKNRSTIERIRVVAFRYDQIYEPPGNIFVTVGIWTTFLGLAMGLINFNFLDGDMQPINDTLSTQLFTAGINNSNQQNAAIMDLHSFMGCMGLALGVSMLGVMLAVAAQWLRGHGPSENTAELLDRANALNIKTETRPHV